MSLESQILKAARNGLSPSSERLETQFSLLSHRVSAGHTESIDLSSLPTGGGGLNGALAQFSPLKLLATGAALGVIVGVFGGVLMTPHVTEAPQTALKQKHRSSVAQVSVEPTDKASPQIAHRKGLPEAPQKEEGATRPSAGHLEEPKGMTPSKSATPGVVALPAEITEKPQESVEAALYRELSFLRQAQSALRQGKPAMALGLMESLDREHNSGALGAERKVTKVLSLCALGRGAEARPIARSLLTALPGSPYAARISKSCVSDLAAESKKN